MNEEEINGSIMDHLTISTECPNLHDPLCVITFRIIITNSKDREKVLKLEKGQVIKAVSRILPV